MRRGKYLVILLVNLAFTVVSSGAQSLGDVARQQRQEKQTKPAPNPPKVITNEDIPESPEASAPSADDNPPHESGSAPPAASNHGSAEQWKSRIQAQRNTIASLQGQIDKLNSSIHFSGPNCVYGCEQYNERQVKKQEQVEQLRKQLSDEQRKLDDLQEGARKAGFGNAVYEP